MTIHELLALTGLTGSDEIPVWDEEASGEPTKKITAQNFAAAIKTLASLLGTGDVVNDLTSSETQKPGSANMLRTLKALLDAGYSSISGSVVATSLSDFDAALTTACSGLAYGESRYIEVYPIWSGSPSGGVVSLARIYRVNAVGALYQCYIFYGGAQGYYYSGSWHWQKPAQSSV